MERYIACMLLHALGDTIGYKNSNWEFFKGGGVDEKLYDFIYEGGINHVPKKGWLVSDDTILHMKTAEALLEKFTNLNDLASILVSKYLEAFDQFEQEGLEKRYPGGTTMKVLFKLKNGAKWNETPYNILSGGSGAAMKSLCIGLAYNGEENRDKLIQIAIECSRITHNSVVGYMGGLTSALFTAFAIENIEIKRWPHMLMTIIGSDIISTYLRKTGRGFVEYENDISNFSRKWYRYIEEKFDDDGNVVFRRSNKNIFFRNKYYSENYAFRKEYPGGGGDDSVIIAYDSLIDAGDSWEKLVIYSMLHSGDTDTTGCIAAGWWGAAKGFLDVPEDRLAHLEYKNALKKLGEKLFKKYYNSGKLTN